MEKYSQKEAQYFIFTLHLKQEGNQMLNDQTAEIKPDDDSNTLKVKAREQGAWSRLHPEMKNEKPGTIKVDPDNDKMDIVDREYTAMWIHEGKMGEDYPYK